MGNDSYQPGVSNIHEVLKVFTPTPNWVGVIFGTFHIFSLSKSGNPLHSFVMNIKVFSSGLVVDIEISSE